MERLSAGFRRQVQAKPLRLAVAVVAVAIELCGFIGLAAAAAAVAAVASLDGSSRSVQS